MNETTKGKFSITIIRNSECLPTDSNGARLWRSGIFADFFYSKGHDVSWVFSSFDHFNKVNRGDTKNVGSLHKIITMLRTPGYKSNLSLWRFVDHFIFGIKVFFHLLKRDNSDVIICSYPTPESSFFTVLYGLVSKTPVVLDIRDQWPDVVFETSGKKYALVLKLLFSPYILMKTFAMKYSTNIMAVNPDFLKWATHNSGRDKCDCDFVSYIPFLLPTITAKNDELATSFINKLDLKDNDILITFAGTLGLMFDFEPLYQVLSTQRKSFASVKVIICGTGGKFEGLKNKFASLPNVLFTGQIDANIVFSLLTKSDLLLAPYKNISNFRNHLPNKFMEYCAAGKPIISSLKGLGKHILANHEAGDTYSSVSQLECILFGYLCKPSILNEKSINAKDLYLKRFHPEIILSDLEVRIEKIVSKSQRLNSLKIR
ncbi:MAG: hypothetical protein COA74_00345 [Gammaproteobacteria bacterium]|nr:MAG: hypothetical protein COA74_00345 [Gammaproteobacteria bacterium]